MEKKDYTFKDQKIVDVDMGKEVKTSYIDYAMSVIMSRALPDVRDGLKPVHRRILYSMYEENLTHDKPFFKSATTVGNVIGRYHPHGDAYVYDAMVMYPEKNGQEAVKTDTYYAVQAMNQELKKFDHVFLKFDWEGTMAVVPEGKSESLLLACVNDYTSPRIKSVSATEEAIIGCQKDQNGYDGFMIVNATDPGMNTPNTVTVKFKEATSAICYIEGEETKIELKDGTCSFDLKGGEGIFVIPVK